jgi:hypothetical protein
VDAEVSNVVVGVPDEEQRTKRIFALQLRLADCSASLPPQRQREIISLRDGGSGWIKRDFPNPITLGKVIELQREIMRHLIRNDPSS